MDTAQNAQAYAQDRANGAPVRMGPPSGLPVPMPGLSGQANGLVGKLVFSNQPAPKARVGRLTVVVFALIS